MPVSQNLTGKKIHRLTFLKEVERTGRSRHRRWLCRCDCGKEIVVYQSNVLRNGTNTRSCGCLRSEMISAAKKKHGHSHGAANGFYPTPEYRTWQGLKSRCTGGISNRNKDYSGRGITVCERWEKSFEAFLRDMGKRPSPAYSIDRTDNDGPYSPENCRWATRIDQANNKRSNRRYEWAGTKMTIREISELEGLSADRIRWTVQRTKDMGKAIAQIKRVTAHPTNAT